MANRERSIRLIGGALLAVATVATRFPFRAHTLFEFDSINFAVAATRFDLGEVTPHMPGYILHVLLGRLLYWILGNANPAYVWLSIILSVGAVLFLWRAAAQVRGERVAVIAAILWLTTPLFWFHGCVSSAYAEEAFFASAMLYLGLKLLNWYERPLLFTLLIAFAIAGAARPNDLLFFLPAIITLLIGLKPSRRDVILALTCFAGVSAIWIAELLRESGGLTTYLYYAQHESNFRTQSLLFGHPWQSALDTIGKVLFYLPIGMGASLVGLLGVGLVFPTRIAQFVSQYRRNAKAWYVILIALPALIFYLFVFFMKAGYLLNVLPSAILITAVLLDQSAIWLAERVKRRPENRMRLTRPIITRNAAWITVGLAAVNCLWFFVSWPGTEQSRYNNENTRNSFIHGALHRFEESGKQLGTLANRAFEYTNISGIRAVDSLNQTTLRALEASGAGRASAVILASWWARWCYVLLPDATTFDIESAGHEGHLAVGISQNLHRENLENAIIRFHAYGPVLLLLRHDRPDFAQVNSQLHLERLPMPEYLDIYRVLDTAFTLRWQDRTFIRE
ncbi:MAG: hypothetical protein Q8922_10290 [Bacteroidota bacterium]|nr:hypothetical protein [Bacteroidota bacterium]MDP4233915.1 hypothetical protein [Bacteroidota bacterium]MDP4242835.1 hypothetical protein [Bacteroidota bacterium]MDP4288313.1 hypothetical protein [Bacteroidota bacterium]